MPRAIPYSKPPHLAAGPPPRTEDKAERDAFYLSAPWRALRAAFLAEHPLCEECERADRLTVATVVHHKIDRLKRLDLALDWANLEASCNPCHTRHHKRGKRR